MLVWWLLVLLFDFCGMVLVHVPCGIAPLSVVNCPVNFMSGDCDLHVQLQRVLHELSNTHHMAESPLSRASMCRISFRMFTMKQGW